MALVDFVRRTPRREEALDPRWRWRCPAAGMPVLVATLVAACASQPATRATVAALSGDVARVGSIPISATLVGLVADAQHKTPAEALVGLTEDALAAEGARARGYDRAADVEWASSATLAKRVAEKLRDEARAQGPPAADELESLTVVHAVVRRTANVEDARAIAVVEAIGHAVTGARSEDEFRVRAEAAPHGGLLVTIQRVGPFDAAGHGSNGELFDPLFVEAAFALRRVRETSQVVQTSFGWHVLQLLERSPPAAGAFDERRTAMTGPVLELRSRLQMSTTMNAVRARVVVEVSGGADQLMAAAAEAAAR
jgi:hypothetical protein